ncbi:hypothetical protein M422DRAFT_22806 [Sphaerobolus stellatus SS14]|nr:hypothetical protein M422DRAFT_22806 [Sphaerobolus stellatus SS14]
MHVLLVFLTLSTLFVDWVLVNAAGVQCNATYTWYTWAADSNGQDPCQLATRLYSSCAPNAAPLQPLSYSPSGSNFYHGPNRTIQNSCTCSYVMYNLLSACGDCQVGFLAPTAWPIYQDWASACQLNDVGGIYPGSIPSAFASQIPTWARLSIQDTGDPRWSYGASKGVATGHFLINTALVTASAMSDVTNCPSHDRASLPIGTAFAGFAAGIISTVLTFFLYRRRVSRVIPQPTRYHTAPDNRPLHPLIPRPAYSQGTNFLRRILEQDSQAGIIEPYDLSTAATTFPPHPAAFPPGRGHTFPPIPPSAAPSRQPSLVSMNTSAYGYTPPTKLRHSRSGSYANPGPGPQPPTPTTSHHLSIVPSINTAGPSNLTVLNSSPSEPTSPIPPDQQWPLDQPPAYRRKT